MIGFDDFPCDSCEYDVGGCCDYDEPLGRYCVLGSAYKPKNKQISIFDLLKKESITQIENMLKRGDS